MNLDQSKLKLMFQGSEDVKFIEFTFDYNIKIMCIYCKGLCDKEFLMDEFIPTLEKHISEKLNKSNILKGYNKVNYQQLSKQEEIIEKVFSGELILYIQHEKNVYSFELGDPPNRQPEETSAEVTVRGPRDGFVESIDINVALIRRRLKTSSLSFETFKVGNVR